MSVASRPAMRFPPVRSSNSTFSSSALSRNDLPIENSPTTASTKRPSRRRATVRASASASSAESCQRSPSASTSSRNSSSSAAISSRAPRYRSRGSYTVRGLAADDGEGLFAVLLHQGARVAFHVQPQHRLGVRLANVQPPVGVFDRHSVEVVDLRVLEVLF